MVKARRAYSIIFLCFLSIVVFSQTNLVPNPSFEFTTACPGGSGNINNATGWYSARFSPDYFHPCANTTAYYMGIPKNFAGSQMAFDGSAYGGLITYSKKLPNTREYIGVQLTSPLTIGITYYISMFIARGDSTFSGDTCDCSTNNIGLRFSKFPFYATSFNPLPIINYSHVNTNSVIIDKINWTQVSGTFIADSIYQYLFIGNFFDDSNTSVNSCTDFAYYYVDFVCVSSSSMTCNVVTGINELEFKEIKVYPNPANNTLILENLFKNEKYEIINIMGTMVKQGFCHGNKNAIDVSDLSNGLYFVMVREKKMKLLISH